MADDVTSKQPSENYFIEFDFSKVLPTGETIDLTNSTISALKSDGSTDATSIVLDGTTKAMASSNKGLVIRVKAGVVADSPYKVTAIFKTIQGSTFEKDISLIIYEE